MTTATTMRLLQLQLSESAYGLAAHLTHLEGGVISGGRIIDDLKLGNDFVWHVSRNSRL